MTDFKVGELIIYTNGDRYEIGKIKQLYDNCAAVYYSDGDTAARTPYDHMHKLTNGYCVTSTTLGGGAE